VSKLDDAIVALGATVARADRRIADAQRLLNSRENDLLALRAWADAQWAHQELAGLVNDQSRWDDRSSFMAGTLGAADRVSKSPECPPRQACFQVRTP
jgi:hypothetical protein